MADEWTRSAIAERLYSEMNKWDENQPPFEKKYYLDALQYANRRAIVKNPSEFKDVFHVYILTFTPELRDHMLRIKDDNTALNGVINNAVMRIIKAKKPEVYYDYLQNEALRWDLINGDGNGKGDGSLIAEHVAPTDTESDVEEGLTIIQRLAKRLMNENYFKTMRDNKELYWYDDKGLYIWSRMAH